MNQLYVHTYPLPPGPPCCPPPIPLIWVITEHRVELPMLFSNFPQALCFTHGSVYMNAPSSSRPLLPHLRPQVCSLCLCLHSCPGNGLLCTTFLNEWIKTLWYIYTMEYYFIYLKFSYSSVFNLHV